MRREVAGGLGAAGPQTQAEMPLEEPDGDLPVLTMSYDLAKYVLLRVEAYPRSLRFTLGDEAGRTALRLHLLLLEAAYTSGKRELLRQASMEAKKLTAVLRMAKDVRAISVKQYTYASRCTVEVGQQIGGWLKSAR